MPLYFLFMIAIPIHTSLILHLPSEKLLRFTSFNLHKLDALELYAENIYVVGRTLEILNCLKKSQKKKSLFLGMSLDKNKSKFMNTWCLESPMFKLAKKRTSLSLNFKHGRGHRRKTWHVIKQIKWQYSTFSKYLYMTVEVYINICIMYVLLSNGLLYCIWVYAKGQLISKINFSVFNSPKKRTWNF